MYKKFLLLLILVIIGYFSFKKCPFLNSCCLKKHSCQYNKPYYLINVLDKKEFDDAHIEQSINVPFETVSSFLDNLPDKKIPLIFYCANYLCSSSDDAAAIAVKKGFTDVSVYQGGMAEWYQAHQNDPVFIYNGPAEEEYLRIVIFPKGDSNEENNIHGNRKNLYYKKVKIIAINDLQKILKEGTIRE